MDKKERKNTSDRLKVETKKLMSGTKEKQGTQKLHFTFVFYYFTFSIRHETIIEKMVEVEGSHITSRHIDREKKKLRIFFKWIRDHENCYRRVGRKYSCILNPYHIEIVSTPDQTKFTQWLKCWISIGYGNEQLNCFFSTLEKFPL